VKSTGDLRSHSRRRTTLVSRAGRWPTQACGQGPGGTVSSPGGPFRPKPPNTQGAPQQQPGNPQQKTSQLLDQCLSQAEAAKSNAQAGITLAFGLGIIAVVAALGALLVLAGVVELLGREQTFGITWVKHLTMSTTAGDAVLIVVGLCSLVAALFARSYSREAGELVRGMSPERLTVWVRILCLSISVICLGSGVWGLAHHLT